MMRIITGSARGKKLDAPEGIITRPTAERTKMAIFNTLQFEIEGKKVLELFGGSGQMSLEALSRGAEKAYICDNNGDAVRIIRKNAEATHLADRLAVMECEYRTAIKKLSGKEQFDIIFLDPPYDTDLLSISLFRIFEAGLVAPGGYVVCESSREEPFTNPGSVVFRHSKYGKAYVTILKAVEQP